MPDYRNSLRQLYLINIYGCRGLWVNPTYKRNLVLEKTKLDVNPLMVRYSKLDRNFLFDFGDLLMIHLGI